MAGVQHLATIAARLRASATAPPPAGPLVAAAQRAAQTTNTATRGKVRPKLAKTARGVKINIPQGAVPLYTQALRRELPSAAQQIRAEALGRLRG